MERYALKFVEKSEENWSAEQLRAAEAQIEEQKRNWEMKRMAAMSSNDNDEGFDALSGEPDSNGLMTYSHNDAVNQVKKKKPGRPRTKSNLSQSAAAALVVTPSSSQKPSPVKSNSGKRRSGRKPNHKLLASNDSIESDYSKESSQLTNASVESEDERPASSTPDFSSRKRTRLSTRSEPVTPDLESLADDDQSPIVSSSNTTVTKALSPRTRSRGAVKINLWSLDEKPHLPGSSPKALPNRVKSEGCSPSPELCSSNGAELPSATPVSVVPTKKFKLNLSELETDPDLDVVG